VNEPEHGREEVGLARLRSVGRRRVDDGCRGGSIADREAGSYGAEEERRSVVNGRREVALQLRPRKAAAAVSAEREAVG